MNTATQTHQTRRTVLLIALALALITLGVYLPVANHQFLSFDDSTYVTENLHVLNGLSGKNIVWALTSVEASNWHPLTWLSHLADVQFYGVKPGGHHLTNVALHTMSALLLLLLLLRLTGAPWQSAGVAALFALHPLHVESVAWVAERKDVLSALFWFLTLLLYAEYAAKRRVRLYLFALGAFILGLMAKPMLVTLPVVMLLLDFWPLGRWHLGEQAAERRHRLMALSYEKIPFLACSLLSALVTIYAQHQGGAVAGLTALPLGFRLNNALIAYVGYIEKTLWPHELAVLYPFPQSIPLWQPLACLVALVLISAAVMRAGRRHPYLAVGWFWFMITLVPVIGIIQVGGQAMADRYTYLPVTGLFIMAAWGIPPLLNGFRRRRLICAVLAVAAISAAGVITRQQLGYWHDDITLYRHTLDITSGNYVMHNNLGIALKDRGDVNGAIREYQQSIRINSSYKLAHNNLGVALDSLGLQDEAIREYRLALLLDPDYTYAGINLGVALINKGYLNDAIRELQSLLQHNPANVEAHYSLGVAFERKGDPEAAIREYRQALRLNPRHGKAQLDLERALARSGTQP